MRCLYCGKELALLKRLTGGGDFCSDAHKQSYQEEYNRLALSRLLQAQKKKQKSSNSSDESAVAAPAASVAVQEAAVDDSAAPAPDAPTMAADPAAELAQPAAELASESAQAQERSLGPAVHGETDSRETVGAEPEPPEPAGFLPELPASAALPEEPPYLESWRETSEQPVLSEWQFESGAFSLPSGNLLSLEIGPKGSEIPDPSLPEALSPKVFASPKLDTALSPQGQIASDHTNGLPSIGAIAFDVAPASAPSDTDRSLIQAIGFETTAILDDPKLLELSATPIDFPAEDSDVVVLIQPLAAIEESQDEAPNPEEAGEHDTPRASLQALSRLHQELAEEEARRTEEAAPVGALTPEIVESMPAAAPAQAMLGSGQGSTTAVIEIAAEESGATTEETKPKYATELFEISIKTFAPAKPGLVGGEPLPSQTSPLLPQLKSLPLRPKMALATGYKPPSGNTATSPAKSATASAPIIPVPKANKMGPVVKTATPAQPAAPAAPKVSESGTSASRGKTSQEAEGAKLAAPPMPAATAKALETNGTAIATAEGTAKAARVEKELEVKSVPAATAAKPPVRESNGATNERGEEDVPGFSIAQAGNIPWAGSLKVKLGIAIILVVIAGAYFLGWGSKKPATPTPAISSEAAGPEIIMGEGGWVEGWGGDPIGLHAGRQITIYRPSLKLSDYRLEFQGTIDTKSLGWIFRAANPQNYYAMKLMAASPGLSPKIALFKYIVANGRQTQAGRVPINLLVDAETVFDVRVDVRGSKFTTYIQGQEVDTWTDDQLKTGGAGFLNEREERGKVKSVSIRYLSGEGK